MDNIKYSNVKKQILPIRKVSRKVYGIRLAIISVLLVLSTNAYTQNCAVNAGVPQTVCENETLTLYGGFVGVSGGAFYCMSSKQFAPV
jgi:hypothetical protein